MEGAVDFANTGGLAEVIGSDRTAVEAIVIVFEGTCRSADPPENPPTDPPENEKNGTVLNDLDGIGATY